MEEETGEPQDLVQQQEVRIVHRNIQGDLENQGPRRHVCCPMEHHRTCPGVQPSIKEVQSVHHRSSAHQFKLDEAPEHPKRTGQEVQTPEQVLVDPE